MKALFSSRCPFIAVLMLGLGACGGGNDRADTAVQPSPAPPSTSPDASRPPASPASGTDSKPSTPASDARRTNHPATDQPVLGQDSIDGGLLATMLIQNTFVSTQEDGRPHPIYSLYGAVSRGARTKAPARQPDAPVAFGYQYVVTDVQGPNHPASFHVASFITNFEDSPAFGRFTDLRTAVSMTLHLERENNRASLFLFTDAAMKAASSGKAILDLGREAQVMSQVRAPSGHFTDDEPSRETHILSTQSPPLTLWNGTGLKPGTVLREWRENGRKLMQLIVTRGAAANQLRLCLNYQLPDAKRLHCSLWRVPGGWQFGRPLTYEGIHIRDDRSVHPGGRGMREWQTPAPN